MGIQQTDLAVFRQCVKDGYSIVGTRDGNWYCRWRITQLIRRLFGWQRSDDLATAQFFKHYLRSKEVKSSAFTSKFTNDTLEEIEQTVQAIFTRIRSYLDEEKTKKAQLRANEQTLKTQLDEVSKSNRMDEDAKKKLKASIKTELRALKEQQGSLQYCTVEKEFRQHCIALKYRQKPIKEIHHRNIHVQDDNYSWIENELRVWKSYQYPPLQDANSVSRKEQRLIRHTCHYPEIVKLLQENSDYKDWYFRFVFRNVGTIEHSVDIAAQFPTIAKLLVDTFLDKRVKRLHNDGIQFVENEDGEKDVQLLVEGVYQSLRTDTTMVTFQDGTKMTIAQIVQELKEKNYKMGTLEYLQNGLSHCTPKLPDCDLSKPNWWEDLPMFETLTKAELEKRYKTKVTEYAHLMVRASASSDNLNVLDNHSWLLIAVPIGNDQFRMLPIGKYANVWPTEPAVELKAKLPKPLARILLPLLELIMKLSFIFETKRAIITCCDENEFYYHRKHFFLHKPLTEDKFHVLMEKIRKDLLKVRHGQKLIFQPQGNNCSAWVQETYDLIFPGEKRLFKISMARTEVPAPLNHVLKGLKFIEEKASASAAKAARVAIAGLFGGCLGPFLQVDGKPLELTNLVFNENFQNGLVELPAALPINRKGELVITAPA